MQSSDTEALKENVKEIASLSLSVSCSLTHASLTKVEILRMNVYAHPVQAQVNDLTVNN